MKHIEVLILKNVVHVNYRWTTLISTLALEHQSNDWNKKVHKFLGSMSAKVIYVKQMNSLLESYIFRVARSLYQPLLQTPTTFHPCSENDLNVMKLWVFLPICFSTFPIHKSIASNRPFFFFLMECTST